MYVCRLLHCFSNRHYFTNSTFFHRQFVLRHRNGGKNSDDEDDH